VPNTTIHQLLNYLKKQECAIIENERSYIIYKDNKYAPPILKEDQEIGETYLRKILAVFGFSIEEFKQDCQGVS
jgi:hypothetical protein